MTISIGTGNVVPLQAMKAYVWWSRGIAALILQLGERSLLYPPTGRGTPVTHSVGPRDDLDVLEKKLLYLPGIVPRFL